MRGWRIELSAKKKDAVIGYFFILPVLVGILVFKLLPAVFALLLSFFRYNVVTAPRFIGLENYVNIVQDPMFLRSLANTAYYTSVGLTLRLLVSMLVALLLNQKARFMGAFRTIYYMPSVASGVAISFVWIWIYEPNYGIIAHVLGLFGVRGPSWLSDPLWAMPAMILIHAWSMGVPMVVFLAGLQSIPPELYEVARIDGAGPIRRFLFVTLPMIAPFTFFNFVVGVITSFQVFTKVYVMTKGGPLDATLVYVMYLYQRGFVWMQMGYASALAWILFLILLAFTILQFRLKKRVDYS